MRAMTIQHSLQCAEMFACFKLAEIKSSISLFLKKKNCILLSLSPPTFFSDTKLARLRLQTNP